MFHAIHIGNNVHCTLNQSFAIHYKTYIIVIFFLVINNKKNYIIIFNCVFTDNLSF